MEPQRKLHINIKATDSWSELNIDHRVLLDPNIHVMPADANHQEPSETIRKSKTLSLLRKVTQTWERGVTPARFKKRDSLSSESVTMVTLIGL